MKADVKPTLDKVNILLVDDQPAKLMSYELILQELDETLLKASSAQEALELLLKNDVAVILADVCMPDLDGFELAQMIREHPRYQDTAIIFISAIHLSDLDSLKGYELGGVDYVPVPVVPAVLRAKVRVFVDLYRKSRELARMNVELEARVADRTAELEAAIARQELLAREVDHRARNALAVIQSIVSLTPSNSPGEFVDAIKGRIRAMASAHNLLSETRWRGADLVRLVNEELAPYRVAKERIRIHGPQVDIMPTVAQNLALAIHELATNAAKYGALGEDGGKLDVTWRFAGGELVFDWDEEAGKPITPPQKAGFGSRVIKSSIEGQLKGSVETTWREDGLRLSMRIPAQHFTETNAGALGPQSEPPAPAALERIRARRILILEDEPLVAMMMAELIEDLRGTVVGPFASVREAAQGLGAKLDAALLDVNVGSELAYPIAEELKRQGIPVIFVTGYQANSIDPRFAHAPVLTKPIEQSELAGALARVLPSENQLARAQG
jgi:two-component sensor histidine kinase/two-component SAPR family response regulator